MNASDAKYCELRLHSSIAYNGQKCFSLTQVVERRRIGSPVTDLKRDNFMFLSRNSPIILKPIIVPNWRYFHEMFTCSSTLYQHMYVRLYRLEHGFIVNILICFWLCSQRLFGAFSKSCITNNQNRTIRYRFVCFYCKLYCIFWTVPSTGHVLS